MVRMVLMAAILSSSFIVFTSTASGLNESTHAIINEQAARQSMLDTTLRNRLGLPEGQQQVFRGKDVLVWVREGGAREDSTTRFFRHFHDPLQPWTSAGLYFFGRYQSSIHWMQRPMDCQDWTWSSARCYFHRALTASSPAEREQAWADTFRAIGQLMHLVVDASVPEHTRNDEHPLGPVFGNYEYWVESLHGDAEGERGFVATYLANSIRPDIKLLEEPTNDAAAPVPIARLIDADIYTGTDPNVTLTPRIGIAEFSNANLFSEDSGYRRFLSPNYPYPSVERLEPSERPLQGTPWVRAYYRKGRGDGLPVDPVLAECALDAAFRGDGIPAPQRKCTDTNVWAQTAAVMLPRAVGYAAALIDYFFRGGVSATYEDESLMISSPTETMFGDFELLYDRSDGTRQHLATWTSLQVDPGQTTPPLFVPQLPQDAAPDAPCWLIFRGQLGLEPGAVVGSQAACPPVPPPPPSSGEWALYTCLFRTYGSQEEVRYVYATPDPSLADDGLPVVRFLYQTASGVSNCGLLSWGLAAQPAGTTTQHPV
jgi:hypothetical protein